MTFCKKIIALVTIFYVSQIVSQQETYKIFNTENGLSNNNIIKITQDNIGYLWLGTDSGLIRFDGDDFKKVNSKKVTSLLFNNKKLLIGTTKGLIVKEGNQEVFYESKKVFNVLIKDTDVFVATNQGICHLKNKKILPIQINTKLDFSIIYDIVYVNNSFFIASNNGLYQIDDLIQPKKITLLTNDVFVDLVIDDEKLLAASNNKVICLNDNKIQPIKTIQNISNISIIENQLWVSSINNGIEIFSLPDFKFLQKINKYNTLKTDHINYVFNDNQNIKWIGTNQGLYQQKKYNINNRNSKPNLYLESVKINFKEVNYLSKENINLNLSSNENSISIVYKTVNLLKPKNILYRYKINNTFSNWNKNNSLQLANLDYGSYTLELQSKIDDVKSDIKKINFTINTPFYYNVYFIISAFILFVFISYVLVDLNIKSIKKKNSKKLNELELKNSLLTLKQKALQLQMNPHFVFNVLNGIKALGNSRKTKELNNSINHFSSLLRSILNSSMKDKITLKEEIEALKNYLELEQKMSSKKIIYSIKTNLNNIDTEEILIPTMLIQPFAENTIHHAFINKEFGKIEISFTIKKNILYCSIKDDGIGFNTSINNKKETNHKSAALKITKERINNIYKYSDFNISELKEGDIITGTNVSFKIPLETDF